MSLSAAARTFAKGWGNHTPTAVIRRTVRVSGRWPSRSSSGSPAPAANAPKQAKRGKALRAGRKPRWRATRRRAKRHRPSLPPCDAWRSSPARDLRSCEALEQLEPARSIRPATTKPLPRTCERRCAKWLGNGLGPADRLSRRRSTRPRLQRWRLPLAVTFFVSIPGWGFGFDGPRKTPASSYRSALAENRSPAARARCLRNAEQVWRRLAAAHPPRPRLAGGLGQCGTRRPRSPAPRRTGLPTRSARRRRATSALASIWNGLRDRLPVWLATPRPPGTLDSLLFWRDRFTAGQLQLAAAVAFAAGLLLLAPWSSRQPRLAAAHRARALLLIWSVATASAFVAETTVATPSCYKTAVSLRSADSAGRFARVRRSPARRYGSARVGGSRCVGAHRIGRRHARLGSSERHRASGGVPPRLGLWPQAVRALFAYSSPLRLAKSPHGDSPHGRSTASKHQLPPPTGVRLSSAQRRNARRKHPMKDETIAIHAGYETDPTTHAVAVAYLARPSPTNSTTPSTVRICSIWPCRATSTRAS